MEIMSVTLWFGNPIVISLKFYSLISLRVFFIVSIEQLHINLKNKKQKKNFTPYFIKFQNTSKFIRNTLHASYFQVPFLVNIKIYPMISIHTVVHLL